MIPVSRISWVGVRSSTVGRRPVDRPALLALDLVALVDRLAEQVEDPAEGVLADRDRDRAAGVDHLVAAAQAVGRRPSPPRGRGRRRGAAGPRRSRSIAVAAVALGDLDLERRVDLGQLVGEGDVDDDAGHLLDPARRCCRFRFRSLQPSVPSFSFSSERLGAADHLEDLLGDLRLARPGSSPGSGRRSSRRRSRRRFASRSSARRARRPPTRAAPGRPRGRRTPRRASAAAPRARARSIQ